ncbi:MAG: uroporphyrinogen-III synthase, partial [Candidatus Dormibacteria bacterium]
ANAVRLVLPRREGTTPPLRLFAIGPGTAAAAARQGWLAEPLPQSFIAEGLIEQLREADLAGRRVLLPRAAGARAVLPAALEQLGAQLELVAVYRMVALESSRAYLAEALRDPRLDCVVFASGSSVGCFAHLRSGRPLPSTVRVVCIGPITAGAAEEAGFQPWLVAKDHSLDGLLAALELELGRLPENGGQS